MENKKQIKAQLRNQISKRMFEELVEEDIKSIESVPEWKA